MTMATVVSRLDDAAPRGDGGAVDAPIEIVRSLEEVEGLWRAFEAEAVMAPYGRYDWVAAFQERCPDAARDMRVAIRRGRDGAPLFLLPLRLERRLGLTVATSIGGKHANYNLPLLRPDFAVSLTPAAARRLLAQAGRAAGADMIALPHVPVAWGGRANPFAAGGLPSASPAWALRLEGSGEATLARSMSAEARKKLRKKARGLAKLGSVRVIRARTPAEVDLLLGAFHRQKEQRLAELGIEDPYSDPASRAFLRDAATSRLAEGHPAIELHGLLVDEEPIAVLGGACDRRRFSGMIVSFQAGAFEKFSPGEMLIAEVVDGLCARGLEVFDLGVGDARYKRSICDEQEALVDIVMPLTLAGRAAALAKAGMLGAKRRIKNTPGAMAAIAKLRRLKAGLLG